MPVKFFSNIVLPSLLAIVFFVTTLFQVLLPSVENAMMEKKREMITELVNTAYSILEKYHRDEQDGLINKEEAQTLAVARIQYLRYGEENKDYFWITDMTPRMIVHPYRPDLNNEDLSDYKDPHGKKVFVESVKLVEKQGNGFVEYMWQWKDDSTRITPKLSYVKAFEPWGWIVGTGIYIQDVQEEIEALSSRLWKISFGIMLVVVLVLSYISKHSLKIEKKRKQAENKLLESREKYHSLVEASTEGMIMISNNGISFVNKHFRDMSGFSEEEIYHSDLTKLFTLPDKILQQINTGIKTGTIEQTTPFESTLYSKNKEEIPVLIAISPILFYGKEAIIITIKDTRTDKQIKDELLLNRDKFKTLMDKLNIGLFRSTFEPRARLTEANKSMASLLGHNSSQEISGTYLPDYFVEEDDKKDIIKTLNNKGFIKTRMIKIRKKNQQLGVASLSMVLISSDSSQTRYCEGILEEIPLRENTDFSSHEWLEEYNLAVQILYQPVRNFAVPPLFCPPGISIKDALEKMKQQTENSLLIASAENEVLGIVTRSDIQHRILLHDLPSNTPIHEIMSAPIISIPEDYCLFEASSFFEKTGKQQVPIRSESGQYTGMLHLNELIAATRLSPALLLKEVALQSDCAGLQQLQKRLINRLLPLVDGGLNASILFHVLSQISDAITQRLIELNIDELGTPPCAFAFIAMGSEGRKEQSFSTDQDNAIIYEDLKDEKEKEKAHQYFSALAKQVCTQLDACAYAFCEGGNMAMNSQWCQPLQTWKKYVQTWTSEAKAKALLDINIFFDFRIVYGNPLLTNALQDTINEQVKKTPAFLYHLAQNTLSGKPQTGFWGNFLIETAGAPPETVNIKDSMVPIVNFARVYALQHQLRERNTLNRLHALYEQGVLTESSMKSISQSYLYLSKIRIRHQCDLLKKSVKADNLINTKNLSDLDRGTIKRVLAHINTALSKLRFDFGR